MNDQQREEGTAAQPEATRHGCLYLLVLTLFTVIDFVEAIPYHLHFYAWCAWHFTGGLLNLHIKLWWLTVEQRRLRKSNPYYRR